MPYVGWKVLLMLLIRSNPSASQMKTWVPWEPEPCATYSSRSCNNGQGFDVVAHGAEVPKALGPVQASTHGLADYRLCHFREKVQSSFKPVHIVVLGGSLTAGTFLECKNSGTSAKVGSLCAWPHLLERELTKGANSGRDIRVTNLAKGGTTTFWALNEFSRIPQDADLVFVDYDVNDGALLNDIPRSNKRAVSASERLKALRERIVAASEVLLRKALQLPKQPALAWVDSFSYDGRRPEELPSLSTATCEDVSGRGYSLPDARASLLQRYGVPRLNIRDEIWPHVNCLPNASAWVCSNTCHHPHQQTHLQIAQSAAHLIMRPNVAPSPCTLATSTLPPLPFTSDAAEIEALHCAQPLTYVSASPSTHNNASLIHQGACWTLTEDRPGKFGWVSTGSCSSMDADLLLTFRVRLSRALPRLSVTYLETFKNAGRADIFVASSTGERIQELAISSLRQEFCGFVDTYRPETHYSQEMVKTFWNSNGKSSRDQSNDVVLENAFRGKDKCRLSSLRRDQSESTNEEKWFHADVTFKHVALPEEKRSKRGGEKVKISGLMSC